MLQNHVVSATYTRQATISLQLHLQAFCKGLGMLHSPTSHTMKLFSLLALLSASTTALHQHSMAHADTGTNPSSRIALHNLNANNMLQPVPQQIGQ
jgi:hypothetical protein